MPKILLADDHAVVRHGLIQILREAMPRAKFGEAETGRETLDLVRRERWDVALLDISLPDKNGLEVLKEIRLAAPSLPVLILSMYPEEQFAVRALRAGAAGYVTKARASEEIVAAVRRVLAGRRYITDSVAESLAMEVGRDVEKPPHERLSDREHQVFGLLARGHTVKAIASELRVSVQTVSTYRSRILEKMGARSNADLTEYALRERLLG
jgi:two-component system invasion response regulator UvrY